ncbi:MAG: malonyl-CoA decarboxylase family protein [Caulobacteraceae bacterium]|nr:malonyl-CoA decarboxylase family protein [Caulobacteraceae bacterium]
MQSWIRKNGSWPSDLVLTLFQQLAAPEDPPDVLALARDAFTAYRGLSDAEKLTVLRAVAQDYGADDGLLEQAISSYRTDAAAGQAAIRAALETRRERLIRRLSLVPEATELLIDVRADVLRNLPSAPEVGSVDKDLLRAFEYWFSPGFLTLRRVDWTSSARLLRQLIDYEAVHEITGWDDLRRRLEPADRRCYAFFHPNLPDTPLIFVEIALTKAIPGAIAELLDHGRTPIRADQATTAVFYSISNCQVGLRGIPFGRFLIKQVMEVLAAELPRLQRFVTLSPAPQFATWLRAMRAKQSPLVADLQAELTILDNPEWAERRELRDAVRPALFAACARYFLRPCSAGEPMIDPVARFHLGNGARLEALQFLGDPSPKGLRQSYGVMVNYLYDEQKIDQRYRLFHAEGVAAVSPGLRRLSASRQAPIWRQKNRFRGLTLLWAGN